MALQGLHPVDLGIKGSEEIWEFPKIGDPNIVPLIVGSLL